MSDIARDEYEAVLGERNYALGELRELRQVVAERNAEVERLTRQLAGAVSALRDLRDRSIDLAALIGPQNSAVFAGWMRAVDAAQRHLGGR